MSRRSKTVQHLQVCHAQNKRKAVEFRQRVFGGWVLISEMTQREAYEFAQAILAMADREADEHASRALAHLQGGAK